MTGVPPTPWFSNITGEGRVTHAGGAAKCCTSAARRDPHPDRKHSRPPRGREGFLTGAEHLLFGAVVARPRRRLVVLHRAPAADARIEVACARDDGPRIGDQRRIALDRAVPRDRDRVVDRLHEPHDLGLALVLAERALDPVHAAEPA